jgi:hypothetical protein
MCSSGRNRRARRREILASLAILATLCLLAPSVLVLQTERTVHAERVKPRHARRHAHTRLLIANALARGQAVPEDAAVAFDPPEQTVGERLFLDTRFAQFFASNYDGNVNHPLKHGDPTVTYVQTTNPADKILGPFAGTSMNCRSCHFVDDVDNGNRTYADYSGRSPISPRGDHQTNTPRNALNMVDSNIGRRVGLLLHGDGEFSSLEGLIDSTMTGRNFGWLPTEYAAAETHIAKVVREDEGTDILARNYGSLSYLTLFLGTDPKIPADLLIPVAYRIDAATSNDEEVFDAVKKLMAAYVNSLTFSRDLNGVHDGSPYDKFLAKNGLPAIPNVGETEDVYSQRLAQAVNLLPSPVFVTPGDGAFETQDQKFAFGASELNGLKLFLRQTPLAVAHRPQNGTVLLAAAVPGLGFLLLGCLGVRKRRWNLLAVALAGGVSCVLFACGGGGVSGDVMSPNTEVVQAMHVGNCIACHVAPNFTDFRMHNTGASQEEYDAVHGDGTFAQLTIPGYAEREANRDAYLPPTPEHPDSSGRFRSPSSVSDPNLADLGLWNVYANGDFPGPQPRLQGIMCAAGSPCVPDQVLPLTIGRFKTPTLRDLAQSQPYLHTGRMDTIEKVLDFYRHTSLLVQAGKLRNGDPALGAISIDADDERDLAAFLRSLNEDYD